MTSFSFPHPATALVTGAAGNIGRAVAESLASHGLNLVLADLPSAATALSETSHRCRDIDASIAIDEITFDVRDADEVDAALAASVARIGTAQFIVNNAGYQGLFDNVLDYDLADMAEVIAINAIGVFHVLQASARLIRNAGMAGSIVNVASMAAHGAPNMPAYSMSKGAVVSLTKASSKDLAPFGIRVNSVSPGFIGPGAMWERQVVEQARTESPYYADDPSVVAEQMIGQVPLGRYGSLDEVARVVTFLLSDDASYLAGSDLEIAGGAN